MWVMCMGTFIILAAYAGNLTSFLSVPQMTKPINTLDDLLQHKETIPSVFYGNSIYQFFKVSFKGLTGIFGPPKHIPMLLIFFYIFTQNRIDLGIKYYESIL